MPRAIHRVPAPRTLWLFLTVIVLLPALTLSAQEEDEEGTDYEQLASMSLEELMSMEVTSVAGVGQEMFKTPAAMYVLSNDELREGGHRSIAESMRMVPGMHVMRGDSNSWNVGARGLGGFTNKTLFLIDGRTTYDLLFSGTFWDVQDVLLEDVDRIEVIRGPGATLWGANAVNGVINVTTKSAKDTQGLYAGAGAGTDVRAFGEMRYGFAIDDSAWMRVWGKWADHGSYDFPDADAHDEWDMARGGMRYDREGDEGQFYSMQAEMYGSDRIGERLAGPPATAFDARAEGGHLLTRFGREEVGGDGWSFQGYYDRTSRSTAGGFQVDRDTFDGEFRHHFLWNDAHETIWGLGFRHTADRTDSVTNPAFFLAFEPRDRSMNTYSGFLQHTVTLIEDTLFVMAGTKLEHNDHTGVEAQPSGRAWWTPNDRNTLWAAISRPVRTPSRIEDDLAIIIPGAIDFSGDPDVEAEELLAYEAGYRRKITDSLTGDLALFVNDYDNLVSAETLSPPGTFPTIITYGNRGEVRTYGGELAGTWQVADNWKLRGSYSLLQIEEQSPASSTREDGSAQNQAQLRSTLNFTDSLEFNTSLYYTDNIPALSLEHYLRLDAGVTWHVNDNLDLSIWGQNLLDPRHPESNAAGPTGELERAVYVMARIRY